MNHCSRCGTPFVEGAMFCRKCGMKLPASAPAASQNHPAPTSPVMPVTPAVKHQPCPKCGTLWPSGTPLCRKCGADMAPNAPHLQPGKADSLCSKCHMPLKPGALFCGRCGSKVGSPAATSPVPPLSQSSASVLHVRDMSLLAEENRPTSIPMLEQWCRKAAAAGIPDPRLVGFVFGRQPRPGEYYLESTQGSVTFGRLQVNGEHIVFYQGQDEDYAVNGFWHTLLERLGLWQPEAR